MAGPAMMFVELNPAQADGSEWDTETIEELAMKWRELLFTGGFSVQVYSIEEKKILITVQKGWEAKGVRDFVVDQPEMTKARVVRDIKRLANVKSLFKLSAGLTRLE